MSIERWLALTALAGFIMAVVGFAQWMAQPRVLRVAAGLPQVTVIELPMVFVTAQRERVDAIAGYHAQLRARVHWVPTRVGRETLSAPDYASRMLLAKAAAQHARLDEV